MSDLKPKTYEIDVAAWVKQQMENLRSGRYQDVDIDALCEEIELLIKAEKRSIKNNFIVLISSLLKWHYHPLKRSASCMSSILRSRYEINSLLEDSPSLNGYCDFAFDQAWHQARRLAMQETGLSGHDLPVTCPWDINFVLQELKDE